MVNTIYRCYPFLIKSARLPAMSVFPFRWRNPEKTTDRGIALVSVLWGILFLSLISLSIVTAARIQARTSHNMVRLTQAELQAEAGLWKTIHMMAGPGAIRVISPGISKRTVSVDGRDIAIDIIPESGKIDLNQADELLISALLAYFGMQEGDALETAHRIVALRQESSSVPFRSIYDLGRYDTISPRLLQCIASYLTVYNQTQGIDMAAADPTLISMLQWADRQRWGGRNWLELNGVSLTAFLSGQKGSVVGQPKSFVGKSYTVRASITDGDGLRVSKLATFRLTGFRKNPVWIYRWEKIYERDGAECPTER